jgi:hypothetical protein
MAEDRGFTAGNLTRTLRIRWLTLHWTGMPPKPRSCNGSREKAKRRRPWRRAGSPVRPKSHGLPRRGRPYPAGVLPSGRSPVGLRLICTAHGGIAPRPPGERDPCTAPFCPSNGTWATKDRMLPRQQTPLSAARPRGPVRHVQRLRCLPGPRLTVDTLTGGPQLTRTTSLPLPEGLSTTTDTDGSAHARSAEPLLPHNYRWITTLPGPGQPLDQRVAGLKNYPSASTTKSQNI